MTRKNGVTIQTLMCAVLAAGIALMPGCEDEDESPSSSSSLAISPTSVRISGSASTNVNFTASGGTSPYTWQVNNSGLGSLAGSASTAVYTSLAVTGRNFVTVQDAATNMASATIDQY